MRSKAPVMLMLLALVALSGCAEQGDSVAIAKAGGGNVDDARTADCDDGATVTWTINGGADLTLTVADGAGSEVFRSTGVGGGSDSGSQTLQGEPGTWTLRVTGSYGGQFSIVLGCQ